MGKAQGHVQVTLRRGQKRAPGPPPRTGQLALATVLLACALTQSGRADTVVVDGGGGGDCLTLSDGLALAAPTDTVLVAPGVYSGDGNRDLLLTSKPLTIASRDGAESTVLELEGHGGFRIEGAATGLSTVLGLTLRRGGSGDLSAIKCSSTAITIKDCVFEANALPAERDLSSAIRLIGCSSVDIEGCRFVGNRGGVFVHTSPTGILRCSFEDNTCTDSSTYGGAALVLIAGNGNFVLVTGCTFSGNSATVNGGAICYRSGYAQIVDCLFADNTAAGCGGAIAVNSEYSASSGYPVITRCTFRSNRAGVAGGAIWGQYQSSQVTDCLLEDNAAQDGGAVRFERFRTGATATPKITRCSFARNTAERGAGILCSSDAGATIQDCTFLENTALIWAGGVCCMSSDTRPPRIKGCTFVRNAAHRGAAIVSDQTAPVVESCTFYGDIADDAVIASLRSSEVLVSECAIAFSGRGAPLACQFGYLEAHQCVIYGNASGDSLACDGHDNLFADPLFCDAQGGDYTLCENSPCLPGNNSWGLLIGAKSSGCSVCDAVMNALSWGRIKALYRVPRRNP
jgi:hypothetical protein